MIFVFKRVNSLLASNISFVLYTFMSLQAVAEGSHDDEQSGNRIADEIQWQ